MKSSDLNTKVKSYLDDWEGILIPASRVTPYDLVNWDMSARTVKLLYADATLEDMAEMLGVSTRTVLRWKDKGLSAYWKRNPDRDDREQWFFLPLEVLFWIITEKVEMPAAAADLLEDWPAFIQACKTQGANPGCGGGLGDFEASGLAVAYLEICGAEEWVPDYTAEFVEAKVHLRKMYQIRRNSHE